MVEVKFAPHWLTLVDPARDVYGVLDVLGGSHGEVENLWAYGHPRRVVHESGASVHFGSAREDQPVVVNLSGEVCEHSFAAGLEWAGKLGARVTRLDVAADVGPEDLARTRLVEMVSSWRRGRVETQMRRSSHRLIKSDHPGDGWTAYFGGRTADLQVRVYDRRGPLRVEHQWRPPKGMAGSVAGLVSNVGVAAVWRMLSGLAVWPMPWFKQILHGEAIERTADIQVSATFQRAMDSAREQLGGTLWALALLGVKLGDLVVAPPDKMRGDVAAKFLTWADDAEALGYNGAALRAEVKCRLTSRSK